MQWKYLCASIFSSSINPLSGHVFSFVVGCFFCYHGFFKKGVKSVGTALTYTTHSKPSDLKARRYLQSSLDIWDSMTSKFKWQTAERAKVQPHQWDDNSWIQLNSHAFPDSCPLQSDEATRQTAICEEWQKEAIRKMTWFQHCLVLIQKQSLMLLWMRQPTSSSNANPLGGRGSLHALHLLRQVFHYPWNLMQQKNLMIKEDSGKGYSCLPLFI